MIERVKNYLKESIIEFKKVNWLTLKETTDLTIKVILFTILFAIFYGIIDFVLSRVIIFIK